MMVFITIQFYCKSQDQNNGKENRPEKASPDIRKPGENPFEKIQFSSRRDTTCGMPLSAGLTDTVHLNDKIHGFCSKECKDDFVNKLKTEKQ